MKSNMEQYWSGIQTPQKDDLIQQYWTRIQHLEGKVTEMNAEIQAKGLRAVIDRLNGEQTTASVAE